MRFCEYQYVLKHPAPWWSIGKQPFVSAISDVQQYGIYNLAFRHFLPIWHHGKRISLIFLYPRGKIETIRPELNLFAVQMVSQSQFFRDLYLLYLMRLPIYRKNMRNFKSNFAQKGDNLPLTHSPNLLKYPWIKIIGVPLSPLPEVRSHKEPIRSVNWRGVVPCASLSSICDDKAFFLCSLI